MKIKTKILLTIILLSLFVNITTMSFYISEKRNDLFDTLHLKINNNNQLLKQINSKLLFNLDYSLIETNVKSFFDDIDIVSIKLMEIENKKLTDHDTIKYVSLDKNNYSESKLITKQTNLIYEDLQLGSIITVYTTKNIEEILSKSINSIVFSFILVTVLISLALYILLNRFIKPITDLTKISSLIASGNLDKNINTESRDEIGLLSNTFEYMRVSLKDRMQLINIQKEKIETFNKELQNKVDKRTKELSQQTKKVIDLLNNAAQGFLSFDRDFLIDNEYSIECENILGTNLTGKDITELLFGTYSKKIPFFKETMIDSLNVDNELTSSLLLSLLPDELIINKQIVLIDYKIISDKKIMIILTNITEKRKLQNKIKKEQVINKMIVSIAGDSSLFYEVIHNFKEFCKDIFLYVNNDNSIKKNINAINALVHTFKGLFAQLYMEVTVKKLHNFESEILELIEDINSNNNDLEFFIESFNLIRCVDKDLETIIEMLGENFVCEDTQIKIDKEFISFLENKIASFYSTDKIQNQECEEILSEIKKIKNKKLQFYFSSYPRFCKQLCLSLNKSIYDIDINSSPELYISSKYKPFINSLVHVFRNCCDHGIETKEDRIKVKKDKIGTISCVFETKNNFLYIKIMDDGKGIDIDALKKVIEEKELIFAKKLDILTEKEIINYIFDDNFSTNNCITHVSGRGIGLASVKMELDKLGGSIEVETKTNEGTTFIFKLPFQDV